MSCCTDVGWFLVRKIGLQHALAIHKLLRFTQWGEICMWHILPTNDFPSCLHRSQCKSTSRVCVHVQAYVAPLRALRRREAAQPDLASRRPAVTSPTLGLTPQHSLESLGSLRAPSARAAPDQARQRNADSGLGCVY